MYARILGRRWRIEFVDRLPDNDRGLCTDPEAPKRTILIRSNMDEEEELDTIIHEAIHASAWVVFDEVFVTQLAEDIARLLYRLGWRKQDESGD